jgi:hypothetical protein
MQIILDPAPAVAVRFDVQLTDASNSSKVLVHDVVPLNYKTGTAVTVITPQQARSMTCSAYMAGAEVAGSQQTVIVLPARIDAGTTEFRLLSGDITAGDSMSVVVTAHDSFGNALSRGGATVQCALLPPRKACLQPALAAACLSAGHSRHVGSCDQWFIGSIVTSCSTVSACQVSSGAVDVQIAGDIARWRCIGGVLCTRCWRWHIQREQAGNSCRCTHSARVCRRHASIQWESRRIHCLCCSCKCIDQQGGRVRISHQHPCCGARSDTGALHQCLSWVVLATAAACGTAACLH